MYNKKSDVELTGATLQQGSEKLRAVSELSVPASVPSLLKISRCINSSKINADVWQSGVDVHNSVGPLISTHVVRNECVSRLGSRRIRKPKWEIELEMDEGGKTAEEVVANSDAGDSYCMLFENPSDEVDFLLKRLGIYDFADDEHLISTEIFTENGCTVPAAIPQLPHSSSPRQMLAQWTDIRRAPNRSVLRSLADHAKNPEERRRLLELSSIQGSSEFLRFIRQANISLVELFYAFPSLKPPLERLIELLPRLIPRDYTLTNYLKGTQMPLRFRFVYSLQERPLLFGSKKCYGVCTQWLLHKKPGSSIKLVQKSPSKFRLPPPSCPVSTDLQLLQLPLWMIGPGTGVAPFISFLQKIRLCMQKNGSATEAQVKRVLIYASSNFQDEYLFKSELEQLVADGVLSDLVLCESRPSDGEEGKRPKRIYDALKERASELADLLVGTDEAGNPSHGLFFACGDVKHMSRELWTCLREILQAERGFSSAEAMEKLKQLRERERLIEDAWS